jgi:hypothetical protein
MLVALEVLRKVEIVAQNHLGQLDKVEVQIKLHQLAKVDKVEVQIKLHQLAKVDKVDQVVDKVVDNTEVNQIMIDHLKVVMTDLNQDHKVDMILPVMINLENQEVHNGAVAPILVHHNNPDPNGVVAVPKPLLTRLNNQDMAHNLVHNLH